MSPAEMTNERMHEPFRKQPAKRRADDAERNWQPKKPKLFLDIKSQPKCSHPHLFEQLHHKTPLAVLNECRKGLGIACKFHKISRDLSFTASFEMNGKIYSETGDSRAMAKQLLAEAVISEMEQDIEKMHVKHAATRLAFHNKDETEKSLSAAGQEMLQRPPPFDTTAQGSESINLTSNDNMRFSAQSRTFDSVYVSASDQLFESSNSITPTSDNRKPDSEVNIEDSAVSRTGSLLTFVDGNAKQRPDIMIRRTAVAVLNSLIPGINWNVTKASRVTVESPLKEFVVSIKVKGENFEGCSRAIFFARQYAAEAALTKLFGMEFRRDVGVPIYHGKLADITRLKKGKLRKTNFLDVHGRNPMVTLIKLFNNEASFQFHTPRTSERSFKHYCTVSVAGMNFEGCDLLRRNAKKKAAFAALAVLRANGMYDQKVAELETARRAAGVSVQQMMAKQMAPLLATSDGPTPVAHARSHPLLESAISRLNRVFPESRVTFQGEEKGSKGKSIFTVDLLVEGEKFVGKGKKLKFARIDASRKALCAFGLWNDLDDQARTRRHVPPKIKQKLHEKHGENLAKGQGNDSAASGSRINNDYSSVDNNYFGTEKFGTSCFGHSDLQGRGISERSYKNNYISSDVNFYDPGDKQASFMDSQIESGNDILIGGNHYGTGNEQARFMSSGLERGYSKSSDIQIGGDYYGTGNKKARFMGSGIERGYNKNNDVLDDGNYYGTGNEQARFMGSGVEKGYNKNNDCSYYDTEDEQMRFMGTGIERRNDNSNDIPIGADFYDTDDRHVSFVGSGVSFAGRNKGLPSDNRNVNSRLLNMARGIPTYSSFSAFETAYQNNENEYEPFSSFNAGDRYDQGRHYAAHD